MSDSNYLSAIQAYRNAASFGGGITPAAEPLPGNGSGSDFMQMVGQSLGTAINENYYTEALTADSLISKTNLDELASAITNADLTLRTIVAVRDKVISAYQDIIKMPI